MKNIIIKLLNVLFLFPVFFSLELKADEVKKADVKKVALNAFSRHSGKTLNECKVIQEIPVNHIDTILFYVYNFEKGFIMVAADNVAEPILGFGLDAPFDFENMPPALHYLLECYQQEILYAERQNVRSSQEISSMLPNQANTSNALLLYHCAIALNSQFGTTTSGGTKSNPGAICPALINNFGFTGTFSYKYSNQQTWIDLLKANIDIRRPVFYTGYRKDNNGKIVAGHGWVVDGYNSSNHFHCNFGWGGSGDNWYLLSNVTPNGKAYNDNQSAVVDIYPTYYQGIKLQNTTITSGTYTGHTITVDNSTIQNNANVILKANCATEIFGPFTMPLGATLEIK